MNPIVLIGLLLLGASAIKRKAEIDAGGVPAPSGEDRSLETPGIVAAIHDPRAELKAVPVDRGPGQEERAYRTNPFPEIRGIDTPPPLARSAPQYPLPHVEIAVKVGEPELRLHPVVIRALSPVPHTPPLAITDSGVSLRVNEPERLVSEEGTREIYSEV